MPASTPTAAQSRTRRVWLPLAALILVAALGTALRLYRLEDESARWDEIVCLQHLDAPDPVAYVRAVRQNDLPMTPVYFRIAYGWSRLFGAEPYTLRLLSVALSTLALLLTYSLAKSIFDRTAGVVAALCFALAPLQLYFAQEIRVYPLVMVLALLSAMTLRAFLRDPQGLWLVLNLLVNFLLVFTHLFAALLVVAEALVLFLHLRRPRLRNAWFIGTALSALLLLAWIATMNLPALRAQVSSMPRPTPMGLYNLLSTTAGTGVAVVWNPGHTFPGRIASLAAVAVAVLAPAVVLVSSRKSRRPPADVRDSETPRRSDLALLFLWWLFPAAGLILVSYAYTPCFLPRYVAHSALPVSILLGGAVSRLPRRGLQAIAMAALALVYGTLAIDNALARPLRADWQSASRHIQARNAPGDPVFYLRGMGTTPGAFPYHFETKGLTGQVCESTEELHAAVAARCASGRGAWVIFADTEATEAQAFAEFLKDKDWPCEWSRFPSARGPVNLCRIP
jgi:hypothetical protein